MPGSYAVARIARGPKRAPGRLRRGDVERRAHDRDVGSPRVELFDLGQERPMPERREPRVRQVELLSHPRWKFAMRPLVPVVVAHGLTVP